MQYITHHIIFLQAAMGAGLLLAAIFGIGCLVGIPVIAMIIADAWKRNEKKERVANGLPAIDPKRPFNWGNTLGAIMIAGGIVVAIFVILFFVLAALWGNKSLE